jgi:ActR/RegA family two-component response regulator
MKTPESALKSLLEKKVNVLFVDDNHDISRFLTDMFSSPLFNIFCAASFEKAQTTIKGNPGRWHCWLLDIDLGTGKSGLDIMKANPHYPFVLILSGLRSMAAATDALKLGAIKAIDKNPSTYGSLFNDVCETADLGFILCGKHTKYLPVFSLLKDHSIRSVGEWAERACITMRQLARICEAHNGINARMFISLYNACLFLLKGTYSPGDVRSSTDYTSFCGDCLEYSYRYCNEIARLF